MNQGIRNREKRGRGEGEGGGEGGAREGEREKETGRKKQFPKENERDLRNHIQIGEG